MIKEDGRAVEAVPKHGVRYTTFEELLATHDHCELRTLGPFKREGMPDAPMEHDVVDKVGSKYDWTGLYMFINPWRDWQDPSAWFCAELIAQATYMFEDNYRVSQQMLYVLSKPFPHADWSDSLPSLPTH